jgi:DNA-binding SARP family transcriptional activator
VEFRVLGTLEVVDGDRTFDIRGAKLRTLLAMLLLHPNQIVSTDRLAEALWGDSPPASEANSLQGYVSHLRRTFAPVTDDLIRTQPPGYTLAVDQSSIDAWRFERLVGDGRQALAAGEAHRAAAILEEALALWRGPVLADFTFDPFAASHATRWEELRLVALEERADAELSLGHHQGLVGELQALVDAHPLRERMWGQLMVALYRCGRQAEALRSYQTARTVLQEELGIDPGPGLRAVEADILAQAPSLEWRPPAAAASPVPSPEATVEGPLAGLKAERVPLPPILQSAPETRLAGRLRELDQLRALWKDAAAGRSGVALVAGEPGIGKTRLVSELAHMARSEGAIVLYGRSDEELEAPYRPFTEALVPLAQRARRLPDVPTDGQGHLGRLVPGFGTGEGSEGDPATERLRLFDAVAGWLEQIGQVAPVLLVVDDLHWADPSSLLLFRHLATTRSESRWLLVGTFRDTDVDADSPLAGVLAHLRRVSGVERVTLEGLAQSEIQSLLGDLGGADVDDSDVRELARWLRGLTDGNPFFIGEVVAHLLEAGVITPGPGGEITGDRRLMESLPVAGGILEVVGRRVAPLPPATRDVLATAAVVGTQFDARVVASVVGMELDQAVDALEPAVARRLLSEAGAVYGRYRFTHALVRQALEESQSLNRRMRLHHQIAVLLEGSGAAVTELAHHFTVGATVADADKAVHYSRLAAREAASRLALEEAAAYLTRALEVEALLPGDEQRRALILLELGEARNGCGRAPEARADFLEAGRLARSSGRPDLLARAAVGYGGAMSVFLDFADTAGPDLARDALAVLPTDDSVERAMCLAKLSMWQTTSPDSEARLQLAGEALAIAERLGDPAARRAALSARLWALRRQPGAPEEQLRLAAELESLAQDQGQAWSLAEAFLYRTMASEVLGDMATAERSLVELEEIAARTNLPLPQWWAAAMRANLALAEGRFDEVASLTARERALAPGIGEIGRLNAEGHFHLSAVLREDWDEVVALCEATLRRYPEIVGGVGYPVTIAWAQGRYDEARAELAAWHANILPFIPAEFRPMVAASLARPTADLDLPDVARAFQEILRPLRGTWCTDAKGADQGMGDHALGLLSAGLGAEAEGAAQLREAVAFYRRVGARAWLAIALADLASVTDEAEEAQAAAEEAAAVADDIGAHGVARRARSLMATLV